MQAQKTLRRLPRLALIPLLFATAAAHAATDPLAQTAHWSA